MTKKGRATTVLARASVYGEQGKPLSVSPPQHFLGDTEVDFRFLTFIEQYASNPIRSEILHFFGSHPEHPATAQDIATQIGRSHRVVHLELYELVLWHVIEVYGENGQRMYRLSDNQAVRDLAIRFALALQR